MTQIVILHRVQQTRCKGRWLRFFFLVGEAGQLITIYLGSTERNNVIYFKRVYNPGSILDPDRISPSWCRRSFRALRACSLGIYLFQTVYEGSRSICVNARAISHIGIRNLRVQSTVPFCWCEDQLAFVSGIGELNFHVKCVQFSWEKGPEPSDWVSWFPFSSGGSVNVSVSTYH